MDFAFKIQYVILAIIFGSLVSILLAFVNTPVNTDIHMFGNYPGSTESGFSGTNFWLVFAVYFPVVTGIMAGANMSGDLENPRKSIPGGTISAVILCTVIYIGLAVVLALLATPEELVSNYNILIDKAFWAPIVVAGLLGASFSSALSSLVGAPRILFALGQNKILIKNDILSSTDKKGEPRNALYISAALVLIALLLRDLNAIAPLLTMFFLITYAMINGVVLIEQSLEQVSFRPTLKVPIVVPLLGSIGCFFAMFIINPTASLISVGLVVGIYILLMQKKFSSVEGDARSGMFNALAEWSAKIVNKLPEAKERAWQPNMIVPAHKISDVVRSYKILYSLARPKGSIKVLGFPAAENRARMAKRLSEVRNHFMEQNVSCTTAIVDSEDFLSGMTIAMQTMKATFFRPNAIFVSVTDEVQDDQAFEALLRNAEHYGLSAYLYIPYGKIGLGLEKSVNLWLETRALNGLEENRIKDINLFLLTAYLLKKNWKANLQINVLLARSGEEFEARKKIGLLCEQVRIPKDVSIQYLTGSLNDNLRSGGRSDLNITYIYPENIHMAKLREKSSVTEASFLYTMDSGNENALA